MTISADQKVGYAIWALVAFLALATLWFTGAFLWGIYAGFAASSAGDSAEWYLNWCFFHFLAAVLTGLATVLGFSWAVSS